MIVGAKLAPFVGNIPLLAFIGYVSSLILGFVLVISVVRRR
jgi:hypothetical protein